MEIHKTVSVKVMAANGRNAATSTGPKTISGKDRVRRNAVKHGLFAREIYLLEEEKAEFQTLRRGIFAQLAPKTSLQNLAFEEIVCCVWRCKLAARLETSNLCLFMDGINHQKQNATSGDEGVISGWYGATHHNVRSAMRFLSNLRRDVEAHGRVRELWKDQLLSSFGAHFFDELNAWLPINKSLILLTDHLMAHAETFKRPLPDLNDKGERIVVDIRERLQMALKLIDQESRHLQDLERIYNQRAVPTRGSSSDFAPGYFTSATRDFHRAVEWFKHLRDNHL